MIKHISVTQEDIRRGVPHDAQACPVYIAVSRVCPAVMAVNAKDIDYDNDADFYTPFTEPLPKQVQDWIFAFDDEQVVLPFEFDLDIPDYVKCN